MFSNFYYELMELIEIPDSPSRKDGFSEIVELSILYRTCILIQAMGKAISLFVI